MSYKPEQASRSVWETIQHVAGLNIVDAGRYIGLLIASAWFYTAARHSGSNWLPTESPSLWVGRSLRYLGIDATWPGSVDTWFRAHAELHLLFIAIALVSIGAALAGHANGHTTAYLALLAACNSGPAMQTVLVFAGTSVLHCAMGLALDHLSGGDSPTTPTAAAMRWVGGPATLLVRVPLLPVTILLLSARGYQWGHEPDLDGLRYASEADELPDSPLAETSARIALPYLAKAIILSNDQLATTSDQAFRAKMRPLPQGSRIVTLRGEPAGSTGNHNSR